MLRLRAFCTTLLSSRAAIANLFSHWDAIDPRGVHILICKCSRCFSDCTCAKISNVKKIVPLPARACIAGTIEPSKGEVMGSLSPRIRSTVWGRILTKIVGISRDTRHCHSMCLIIMAATGMGPCKKLTKSWDERTRHSFLLELLRVASIVWENK